MLGVVALFAVPAVPAAAQGGYATEVAAADGTVFVAEPANIARPGVVYAYRRGADGRWAEASRITAPNAENGDNFGASVAASGNTLLVSHVRDENARGSVYVYELRGGSWQQAGRLVPSDAVAGDSVGIGLTINGDVAMIAAAGSANRVGAVYVFRRSGGRWTQEAKLTPSNGQPGDQFGAAIAVSERWALIGAPLQEQARGGAYLFSRDASGTWTEVAHLISRTVSEGSRLGTSVALSGDQAIVGAPGRDESTGAVYIFTQPQGEWLAFGRLFPYDGGSQTQFGTSLSVRDDGLWVGAPGADTFQGAIYRYVWDAQGSTWGEVVKLRYPASTPGSGFAAVFDVDDALAVAGLPGAYNGEGAAVVYGLGANGEWEAQGEVASELESFAAMRGEPQRCQGGTVGSFECSNIEVLSFLPVAEVGGERGVQMNDIWGWTDPQTNREYALAGRTNGTSFIDVTDPGNPIYLGDLPMTEGAQAAAWRDIKVYSNHAYIVADGSGAHGMQVFDLTRLRNVQNPPQTFTADVLYDNVFSAHNVVINEAKAVAYIVGANSGGETCGGGLHMVDISTPKEPVFAGCFADTETGIQRTGYSHDAQCVTYNGPDAEYRGREICLGANETMLSIADVTDPKNPKPISRAAYPNVAYSHQGWLTEDHRYFYMDDEGDEASGVVPRTRTIIWDVADLDDPQVIAEYLGETGAIDHNLYIKGDTMYQSNYVAGLRVIDISDRTNPREIGFLDSVPNSPNNAVFNGSWSNYPYFPSGSIVFSSGREGIFVVRVQRPVS